MKSYFINATFALLTGFQVIEYKLEVWTWICGGLVNEADGTILGAAIVVNILIFWW